MKRVLMLLFGVMCLVGCERNGVVDPTQSDIDSTKLNQPEDPTTWSPVGKMYVCDRSEDNPYEYEYFMEVIQFFSADSAVFYGTTHRDLSPMEEFYNPASYKTSYPNITLTFGADKSHLNFVDTLTLRWESHMHTYTLH